MRREEGGGARGASTWRWLPQRPLLLLLLLVLLLLLLLLLVALPLPAPPRGIPAGGAVRAAWRAAGGRVVVAAVSSAS